MENLYILGSNDSFFIPTVDFDVQTGVCTISGESFLENVIEFYEPLVEWLRRYGEEIKKPITLNFKLTYFNTSSSKSILDMLYVLRDYKDNGGEVTVNWYYQNPDIIEEVEDFMIETELEINTIEI